MQTAQVLAFLFLTFTYCGGLPILLPVFSLYLFFKYWFEKYKMLRVYRKPPRFDAKIHKRTMRIIPIAIFIHLAFSWWVYTNQDIFPYDVGLSTNGNPIAKDISLGT